MKVLRQNLAVESDLQGFSGLVLESIAWLKGSPFAAIPVLLSLMQKLRAVGRGRAPAALFARLDPGG